MENLKIRRAVQHDAELETSASPLAGRSKSPRWNKSKQQNSKCIADGCGVELVGNYSLRYRLCEDHIRSLSIRHMGIEKRFCQQCSRLHDVNEFDGKRRSCRDRLRLHKERQRQKLAKKGLLATGGKDDDESSAPSTPTTPLVDTPSPSEARSVRPSKVCFNDEPQVHQFYSDPIDHAASNGGQRIVLEINKAGEGGKAPVILSTTLMKPARPVRSWKSMGSASLTAIAMEAQATPSLSGRSASWGGEQLSRLEFGAIAAKDSHFSDQNPATTNHSGRTSTDGSELEDVTQDRPPLSLTLSRGFSSGDILQSLSNLEDLGFSGTSSS